VITFDLTVWVGITLTKAIVVMMVWAVSTPQMAAINDLTVWAVTITLTAAMTAQTAWVVSIQTRGITVMTAWAVSISLTEDINAQMAWVGIMTTKKIANTLRNIMTIKIKSFLVIAFIFCASVAQAKTATEVFEKVSPSVVVVRTYDAKGRI